MKLFRRLYVASLTAAALLFAVDRSASEEPFSRSRWVTERKAEGARFAGGVVPRDPLKLHVPFDAVPKAAGPKNFRVSFDVLPVAVGSEAQPETQTEPHIAVNPRSEKHLLAGYQEQRFSNGGARGLISAVSFNAGKTWTETAVPGIGASTGGFYDRVTDPWVAFGPDNRAYYATLGFNERTPDNAILVSVSPDGGRTWNPPVEVYRDVQADFFNDKEAIVVDTRDDSPFRGRVYVGWDTVTRNGQILRVAHSSDHGATWSVPATLTGEGANIGVIPLVGPGGVVHAVWLRGGREDSLWISSSHDGGVTWSAPFKIIDLAPAGVFEARTGAGIPSAAVDPRNGTIYVVWQDQRFSPRVDQVVLVRSTDGGLTWTDPVRVSAGPLDAPAYTPAVAVNAAGVVGVSYFSLRNDPVRRYFVDTYIGFSKNGGKTFRRTVRLSQATTDTRFAAFSGGYFLGDYQGLAAGAKRFFPLWIATVNTSRLGVPAIKQPDAFVRPIAP